MRAEPRVDREHVVGVGGVPSHQVWVGRRQSLRASRSTSLTRLLSFTDVVCVERKKEKRKSVRSFLSTHPCLTELRDFCMW